MLFEWDSRKNRENLRKHGIRFELACEVFGDPLILSKLDRIETGEERWHSLGSIRSNVVIIVIHTVQLAGAEEVIRIISARKATRLERSIYEDTKS
ncbi:MAG: BrnT family toxin [Gammaproteobacteria bacterium]|nr:BrnT family toxin [Gammaproteobacteria bacterium]